jgi:3-methyladenine DNA glycosylase AlkD
MSGEGRKAAGDGSLKPKALGRESASSLKARLRERANAVDGMFLQRFFKTGPGEYGEGDVFIGVRVPALRQIASAARGTTVQTMAALLRSPVHEDRALALMLMVQAFAAGDDAGRRVVYELYLANTRYINNWDLVDLSAAAIVGRWLFTRRRTPLTRLSRSASVWERRIAIVATHHFIRHGEFADTFQIADRLSGDPHDLIHKAVGWMLREVGKRDGTALRAYLRERVDTLPRTALRYAIERFPEPERLRYLRGTP